MEWLITILLSVAIGLIVGMLSGMLGIGGGTVLVAVFKLLYGMPAVVSTATSLFTIIPTSLTGAIAHIRYKTCIPLLGLAAGIGGACMSPIGVWLSNISPEWAVMVVAALVIGYSAYTMFRKALKLSRSLRAERAKAETDKSQAGTTTDDAGKTSAVNQLDDGARNGAKKDTEDTASKQDDTAEMLAAFKASTPAKRQILVGFLVGLIAGIASGYIGVGGGFIMVPMFMQLLGTPMKKTSGTSLIAVMILAIPGVITQAIYGNVNWLAGIFVSIGSIPGAVIGSHLMKRIPERTLRFIFSAFLLVAATMLIVNQLGIL